MAAITKCFFVFGLIWGFGSPGIRRPPFTERRPFGPKLCSRLCYQVNWCWSYTFSTSSLICHLLGRKSNISEEEGEFLFNTEKEEDKKCSLYSRFVHTRSGVHKCTVDSKDRDYEDAHHDSGHHATVRRLLVALHKKPKDDLIQIWLSNNSLGPYPFMNKNYITSIAFCSKTREVFVSFVAPYGISKYQIDSSTEKQISKKYTSALALEENEKFVFFTDSRNGMYRMTIEGGSIMRIIKYSKYYSVSVDSGHKRLYAIHLRRSVISASYDGKIIDDNVISGTKLTTLYFDSTDNVLYYGQRKTVFRLYINFKIKEKFVSFKADPQHLVYLDGAIYATFKWRRLVSMARFNGTITNISTGTKFINRLIICVVE